MTNFSEQMSKLLQQLEKGDISPDQFKALSANLIETVGTSKATAPNDPVRLERIDTAEKILRDL